jgi:hypothetical protein
VRTTCIPAMMLHQRAGDFIAPVRYAGGRFVIERHREAVAAFVSVDDPHRLEAADQLVSPQRTQCQEGLSQARRLRKPF